VGAMWGAHEERKRQEAPPAPPPPPRKPPAQKIVQEIRTAIVSPMVEIFTTGKRGVDGASDDVVLIGHDGPRTFVCVAECATEGSSLLAARELAAIVAESAIALMRALPATAALSDLRRLLETALPLATERLLEHVKAAELEEGARIRSCTMVAGVIT